MTYSSIAISCGIVIISAWVFNRVFNWLWLKPKTLEKILRQQGFSGNPYKFLVGDLHGNARMMEEAKSRPMPLSNDVVLRVLPQVQHFISTYGNKYFEWYGPMPNVNIQEPELVKEILTKNLMFQKPKINPLVELLATGVAAYESEKWTKHRKIINPAFHMEKLKGMLPAMCLSCDDMMSKFTTFLSSNDSSELDVWPYFQTLTSDVISRTAFGSNYDEGRKIFQLQREQTNLAIEAVNTVYIPGWRFLPTKRNKRMKEIYVEVQNTLMGIIDKRLKAMETGENKYDDLLGILLKSNMEEIRLNDNNKLVGMSMKEVIEECKLFYFAGQETTSVVLTWMVILLGWHQNWQQKAREEIMQAFGDQTPNFDGLNHLKIVTSILYEVMRLYPPLAIMSRTTNKETKLGGMSLPAGVILSLPIILMHYDSDIWGDDAKEFNPERFYEGVSTATKNQFSYFPFGWGPRICVGQNFAMLEMKLAMAMILQKFSFELSPSYMHAPHLRVLLQPQYGAHLILHKV